MTTRHMLLIIFSVVAFVVLVVFGAAHSASTLMNRIHNEGRSARQSGWPIEANPYAGVNSVHSEAWIRGYMKSPWKSEPGAMTVTLIGGFNDGVRVPPLAFLQRRGNGMKDWQPIETARKDRKSILVWCPDNKCQYMVTWDDDGWFVFGSFTKLTRPLTHWRELPSSPEVEPQPQQPLRWVENSVPDKPGIWAYRGFDGVAVADILTEKDIVGCRPDTRCYLGPIPEILPPVKKVVEQAYMVPVTDTPPVDGALFEIRWASQKDKVPKDWIRTDRTREVER